MPDESGKKSKNQASAAHAGANLAQAEQYHDLEYAGGLGRLMDWGGSDLTAAISFVPCIDNPRFLQHSKSFRECYCSLYVKCDA